MQIMLANQCDQNKVAKCLKLHKKDFTRIMKDFDTFTKLPKNMGVLGKILLPQALKSCQKCNKFPNLVTLLPILCLVGITFSDLTTCLNEPLVIISRQLCSVKISF